MRKLRGRGSLREVEISLRGISDGAATQGAERLRQALGKASGLMSVALDEKAGVLRLAYDPRHVSPVRVQAMASLLEPGLARRFERCTLCVLGLRGTQPAPRKLEQRLEEAPGVARALVCPASGRISVEFDSDTCSRRRIEEEVEAAGYEVQAAPRDRAALQAAHAEDARVRRRNAILTATCAVSALAGWIVETRTGAPRAVALMLYVVSYLAGGFDATVHGLRELRRGGLNVDVLMVLAALGAAAVGDWPEGATLLFLFSLSHTLEGTILGRTRRAIEALMDLAPEEAVVLRDGVEQRVAVSQLVKGDRILVRPGERIAADGIIQSGHTAVDQSAMTGESIPVERGVGDPVFAATLNGAGAIEVEVSRAAGDTALARIVRMVEEAQSEKAPSQRFTEWFGARYTLGVLLLAGLTMGVPWLVGQETLAASFYRAMTVLVVASPCAVVISIPAAILSAIAGAARVGILFKGGAHLEEAGKLRAVALDKTGTLTIGRPRVVEVRTAGQVAPDDMLRLAASAESLSEHPLSRAVVDAARERQISLVAATDLKALVGRGIRARVGERSIHVGKPELLTEQGLTLPPSLVAEATSLAGRGQTVMYIGDDSEVLGILSVADTLRPTAEDAIRALRARGIEHLVMLTGDQRAVATAIAAGLDLEFEAELLPENKLAVIQRLRDRYGSVAMVGDGINDAPLLASASLGVSLGGGGTDVALETADVVLMSPDLTLLAVAIDLSRRASAVIRQNLVFAFGMMGVLLTVTYLGRLPLPLAVLGHEGSTVLVILNGVRLLRKPRLVVPVPGPSSPGR
ncbi:MAG: heavy metal translocating P-type ATPase [Isosphaeraceae bacterium]